MHQPRPQSLTCLLLFAAAFHACLLSGAERGSPRQTRSLNGAWQFRRDQEPADTWKTVQVPSTFQAHEGAEFHGVGWYRKVVDPFAAPAGSRVLLHFQAAATEAEVWWDGELLGGHLGGWTPFRFDVTELVRRAPPGRPHELRVRLDEKVGHNTQGFLPVIEPHFGGLWQDVRLLIVPETYVNDLELMSIGEPDTGELRLELPIAGTSAAGIANVGLRYRLRGKGHWAVLAPSIQRSGSNLVVKAAVPAARLWSPAAPNLYEVEIKLPGRGGDRIRTRAAFRSMQAVGREFRLNGSPVSIRGLLNWGYSAPLLAPNPGEAVWRSELEFARARGFNLMKFCLWVPPPRYLELADEMGMLTWMEYPTWHPSLTGKFLEPLRREFREFFLYDRNHPSVVLRSLTCETGPAAELEVIRSLYNEAHQLIPGALVEDDSSWIGWNRVHDFYDDHPYGNNHTWVKTLDDLNQYVLEHGLKPLALGETTAADTWPDRRALLARLGRERPWWAPGALDDSGRWLSEMRSLASDGGLAQLGPESLRYAMLMRKYQIETFRRLIPTGGYVISVIRDFPGASMGLLDYLGRPKWTESDWAWQGDTICLLETEGDRRSFASGEALRGRILLTDFASKPFERGRLTVTLEDLAHPRKRPLQSAQKDGLQQRPGTLAKLMDLDWPTPTVTNPAHLVVRARLKTSQGEFQNDWPVWVVPKAGPEALRDVLLHSSLSNALRQEPFAGCPDYVPAARAGGDVAGPPSGSSTGAVPADAVVVASHFDDVLANFLEGGGRVLFLPDGQQFSLPLSAHWFLRGGPYIPDTAVSRRVGRDLLVELQHFALAADVVPNLPQLDSVDPILLLWDTHDLRTVKTHGIIFETRVGKGRLLVSAARHTGRENAAGRWLLSVLLDHLRSPEAPRHALAGEVWEYARARLHAEQTNLVTRTWRFKPDPDGEGLARGWQSPQLTSAADWNDIRVGNWWELQGYPALDGWAWYRLWVDIPPSWRGRDVFLSFEGVDDCYELYINGELAGKGGDLATRKDALGEKKSHNITRFVQAGARALIAVRVYDWYGYGGIYRPVTLGTLPFNPSLDFLK